MISIIIPMYNVKIYIEKCVNSIIQQTYSEFEIIIVDDGSSDGSDILSDEIAKKDSRIRVIHKANGGVSSARNCGLDAVKGEYIMFVDADDYLKVDLCEVLVSRMKNSDIAIGGYEQITKTGNIKNKIKDICIDLHKNLNEVFDELYIKNAFNSPFSKLYRREIIGKQRFNRLVALGEDFLFNLEYLRKCQYITIVDTTGYMYNCLNENSATKKFRESDFNNITLNYKAGIEFRNEFCGCNFQSTVIEERFCLNGVNLIQLLCYGDFSNKYKKEKIAELMNNSDYSAVCEENYGFPLKYLIPLKLIKHRNLLGVMCFFSLKKNLSKICK